MKDFLKVVIAFDGPGEDGMGKEEGSFSWPVSEKSP